MSANVTSLAARRRTQTVEDAVASIHAGLIADYLTAAFNRDHTTMKVVLDFAAQVDAEYPGGPSLIDQLRALRSSQAA
jgi:hypothetical protein